MHPSYLLGVPINMGIKWRLLYRLCFKWGFFRKYNFVTSQLKRRKLLVSGFSKCALPFFTVKMDGDILKKSLQTRQSDQAFLSDFWFFYSLKNKLLLFELKRGAKRLKTWSKACNPSFPSLLNNCLQVHINNNGIIIS